MTIDTQNGPKKIQSLDHRKLLICAISKGRTQLYEIDPHFCVRSGEHNSFYRVLFELQFNDHSFLISLPKYVKKISNNFAGYIKKDIFFFFLLPFQAHIYSVFFLCWLVGWLEKVALITMKLISINWILKSTPEIWQTSNTNSNAYELNEWTGIDIHHKWVWYIFY